jgi:hypothetical protein
MLLVLNHVENDSTIPSPVLFTPPSFVSCISHTLPSLFRYGIRLLIQGTRYRCWFTTFNSLHKHTRSTGPIYSYYPCSIRIISQSSLKFRICHGFQFSVVEPFMIGAFCLDCIFGLTIFEFHDVIMHPLQVFGSSQFYRCA